MAQNEEHSALYEVEKCVYIYYNDKVFESFSRYINIFERAKDNPANMEVVKINKGI
jgi:hypothetical protein